MLTPGIIALKSFTSALDLEHMLMELILPHGPLMNRLLHNLLLTTLVQVLEMIT